jgi:hypothetical protein
MLKSIVVFILISLLRASVAHASPLTITITGTIMATSGRPDTARLFGLPIESLIGSSYIQTITTEPSLNGIVERSPGYHSTYGGSFRDLPGAPSIISLTLNGTTFTQTILDPFFNRSYLLSVRQPNFMDQIVQESRSSGCGSDYGFCVSSVVNAYSLNTPFLTSLDFDQSLVVAADVLAPGSLTYFSFRDGPTSHGSVNQYSEFYGSVATLTVNPVPEPSTLVLFAGGLGMLRWRARHISSSRKRRTPPARRNSCETMWRIGA